MSTPSTSTFSGSPPHLAATRVPPACSGRSTRGPRRGRFWERVHAHRRAPAGSDWHPLRRGPWRPAMRGGPARPCLGGGGSAWGDALGVRTGVLVSGDGPVMRGVRDVGQGAGVGDRRHGGSVTAECGRRGSTVKAGRSLRRPPSLCPCPGFTGSGRLRHPLGRARFGTGVTPCNPRFAAQAQARLSWRAKRLRFGGHREVASATSAPLPSSGVSGASLPVLRKPHPRGTTQAWAGGTPRQQER